jgi:hypothetical protein
MYLGLNVKYRYCCQILMKFEIFLDRFTEKSPNIEFYENPSSGSQVVPREQTDGQTDMMKVIVAFCNFANSPRNPSILDTS